MDYAIRLGESGACWAGAVLVVVTSEGLMILMVLVLKKTGFVVGSGITFNAVINEARENGWAKDTVVAYFKECQAVKLNPQMFRWVEEIGMWACDGWEYFGELVGCRVV